MNSTCNICGNDTQKIFDARILDKYAVNYYQCGFCEFIQTVKPYWLNEAYTSAITSIDVGLVFRNVLFSNLLPSILDNFSSETDAYLDYGGGYGLFVRMMRDKGYDFYLHDRYAQNLFARHFELNDRANTSRFAALTAFEVFEHLDDPIKEIEIMFSFSDTIIFSTEIQQKSGYTNAGEWWYFMPETGQHIAFYSTKSLEYIAEKFGGRYYSNGANVHILTRKIVTGNLFGESKTRENNHSIFSRIKRKLFPLKQLPLRVRPSLLHSDFELYKKIVSEEAHQSGISAKNVS